MESKENSGRRIKNIWFVQTGEPLPLAKGAVRMRTSLLADKFIARGCDVTWWTSAFDHFSKRWISDTDKEIITENGLKIFTIKGTGYKKNLSLARFIDHRIIAGKFRKLAYKKPTPDIIVASMPPYDLAYEAVRFGRENGVPVVVDIRDHWPAIFMDHVPIGLKTLARFLLRRDFNMAKEAIGKSDALTAVTHTLLDWGLNYAGREKTEKDRVFYLGYKRHQVAGDVNITKKNRRWGGILDNKFVVLFVGTISGMYHDPFILLDAAERLKKNKDIRFVIAGDGESFSRLKKRTGKLSNVTLTGWLDNDEIEFLLEHSSIGVSPTSRMANITTNKLYAYFSAGLPVISSFTGETKELLEKNRIGYYYAPGDVDTMIGYIEKLYNDKILYQEMSENSKRIFCDIFNADKIYEEYAEYLEESRG